MAEAAEQIEAHGLTPGKTNWKLFHLDGFTLLVEAGPNNDGEGYGLHYKTIIADGGVGEVAIWAGHPDERGSAADAFEETFRNLDDAGARRGLNTLLRTVAPLVLGEEAQ